MITLILLCRGGLGSGQLQQSKFESLGSLQFLLRKNCLKRMKLNEIDAGDGQFLNELFPFYFKSFTTFYWCFFVVGNISTWWLDAILVEPLQGTRYGWLPNGRLPFVARILHVLYRTKLDSEISYCEDFLRPDVAVLFPYTVEWCTLAEVCLPQV